MTKQERAEMYRSFLASEGYTPKIDSDGDVAFKFEGGNYYILVDDKDEAFFRLAYPGFWEIESEEERAKVIEAALHATAQTKVTKVFPVRNNTWATIEMFCSPPEVFQSVFHRCLTALRAGVVSFQEKMRE